MRSFLNKSHYAKHYKKFGTYVNWLLCKKYHLECSDKCCTHTHTHTHTHKHAHARTHTPKPVQGNDKYKTPWDFNIQTNKVIEHRLPELVCISKQKWKCKIIDFAILVDQNIAIKEQEKLDKY